MITTAKVLSYDGKTLILEPETEIGRELLQKQVEAVEIRLSDGREISVIQRKKIFATIRDISRWSGHDPEDLRQQLTWNYRCDVDIPPFSLSNVDMTTARGFLTFLIDFCFYHDVPTKDTLLNYTDDIGKYLYLCLEHQKCAICNKRAEIHHTGHDGVPRNKEHNVYKGLTAIALCEEHHDAAHEDEKALFDYFYIYGIKLDKYLCECLSTNNKRKR